MTDAPAPTTSRIPERPTLDGLGPCGGNLHASERSPDGAKLPEYVTPGSFVPKGLINYLAIRELLSDR